MASRRRTVLATVIFLSMFLGCISQEERKEGITLTVLTRHDTALQEVYEKAFLESELAKNAGITNIQFMQPASALWPTAIERGGIDVAWGGGPTLFDQLIELDLLYEIKDPGVMEEVNAIPDDIGGAPMKRYKDGKLMWVAAAISSFGFTVNHKILQEYNLRMPVVWDDLASPEFYKEPSVTAIGNAPDTTSNTRIYEIIIQKYGWEEGWIMLTQIAANSAIYYSSVDVLSAVERGDVAVAITIDFYGYSAMLDYPDTEYVIPQGQSIINADPIVIVANTEKLEAANAFIKFVLSSEGQSFWLDEKINRMPVREDAFKTEFGKTRQDLKKLYEITVSNQGIEFSDELALSYEAMLKTYFEAVFDKPHKELKEAWAALIMARSTGAITEAKYNELLLKLGKPLLTIKEAQELND
ncbi:MAG: ABC transporter substrate-binding protein, partial [Candidatus Methanofastidiosia archaeon]